MTLPHSLSSTDREQDAEMRMFGTTGEVIVTGFTQYNYFIRRGVHTMKHYNTHTNKPQASQSFTMFREGGNVAA